MRKSSMKSVIALLCTAIIWGFAFITQRLGMDNIGPLYFNALRSIIACVALGFVSIVFNRKKEEEKEEKSAVKGGIFCGIFLFFAMAGQQTGLVTTDAGKAGFITALYILLVPLIGLLLGHKTTRNNWIGVVLGVVGLYLLCVTSGLSIERGDLVILLGAFFWAGQILVTDHYAPHVSVVKLSAMQFLTAGVLSFVAALLRETITVEGLIGAMPALLYVGIMSSAVAFTLQAYGQKDADPTLASIVMSTEALWAAVFGAIFLHEVMTGREYLGSALMFAAIIIAQIPDRKKKVL